MSRAMGSHQSARAETTTWLTPKFIIDALGPFDLDPCAAPSPRPWATATRHIELPEDGLEAEWDGHVWLNPPYSFAAWTWLGKLAAHGDGIALIFARTETAGFVTQVWEKATGVLFLHGRLYFHKPDGERAGANSGAPSCLVAYGPRAAERLMTTDLPGTYVPLNTEPTYQDHGNGTDRRLRRALPRDGVRDDGNGDLPNLGAQHAAHAHASHARPEPRTERTGVRRV